MLLLGNSEDYEEFNKGIWRDNPVFVQVLGMCPMLAVTNSAINAVAMGGATLFVLVGSSFLVSIFKNLIPKQIRISCFIIIIATFVTIADYTLLALVPAVHKELGAFIPLIVANCMILGRQEAFASKSTPRLAVMDALGMSTGFMIALLSLGSIREIFGTGTLFGVELFGPAWEPWVIMILPPGGFLTLGLILLFFNWMTQRKAMFLEQVAEAEVEGSSQ
ncbi:MAG: electron transport complex subunit RsxE [Gammaproteobacteria bacterium]|jgi:electron transport complex protein RnfE|nr:electron transport complex subunit RsxE [Gammaproteobacteria bacterium]MDP6096625.1 electron transport complex subunit RsxE [Gammaproteobacteria bacterium]HJO12876.1 electron transport complex subunit RsxE [Gammaproteobacteria bacterium]|tara:strand:+ start:57 stop:716 length:660 start_codon:yes stop_codon:yes gene_type:complete